MRKRGDTSLALRIRIAELEADVGFVVSEPALLRRNEWAGARDAWFPFFDSLARQIQTMPDVTPSAHDHAA